MLLFQEEPDRIFLAIVHTALEYLRDVHLVCYRQGYRPTPAERQELDDSYADLFPELAPFFTRRRLIGVIECHGGSGAPTAGRAAHPGSA